MMANDTNAASNVTTSHAMFSRDEMIKQLQQIPRLMKQALTAQQISAHIEKTVQKKLAK